MSKLTLKQKRQMIARYLECGNYSAVAREFSVCSGTVKRVIEECGEDLAMVRRKLEEQERDVSAYMESKTEVVCNLIDDYLAELTDRERVKSAPLNQIASAMGVVIDKFLKNGKGKNENGILQDLVQGLKQEGEE